MLREAAEGLHDLADAIRNMRLPDHVSHHHEFVMSDSVWQVLAAVGFILLVWVIRRWK